MAADTAQLLRTRIAYRIHPGLLLEAKDGFSQLRLIA